MNVSQVLVRDVETANTGTPLREVARRMRERGIGFMPILEGDKLVGVMTDRDIATRAVSESKDPEKAVAGDVMSLEVVCCFEDDSTEHLPRRLKPLLSRTGFQVERVEPVVILNTGFHPNAFSFMLLHIVADYVRGTGQLSPGEVDAWVADVQHRGGQGATSSA